MNKKQQLKFNKLLDLYKDKLNQFIINNKLDDSPDYVLNCIISADPDIQGKNSKWLINNTLNGNILWEDIESGEDSKSYDTLSRFMNIRKQFTDDKLKDINQFHRLGDIAQQLRGYEVIQSNKSIKNEEKEKIYKNTIFLYDKDGYKIIIPKTKSSSCFWGLNTEWCTAATKSRNMFNYYNNKSPLYICITPDGKKYQFNRNSVPMDENDKEIKNIDDPVLKCLALLNLNYENLRIKKFDNTLSNDDIIKSLGSINHNEYEKVIDFLPKKNSSMDLKLKISNLIKVEKTNNLENFMLNQQDIDKIDYNNFRKNDFYKIPLDLRTKDICVKFINANKNHKFYRLILEYIPEHLIDKELCSCLVDTFPLLYRELPIKFMDIDMKKKFIAEYYKYEPKIKNKDKLLLDQEMCNKIINNNLNLDILNDIPNKFKNLEFYKALVSNEFIHLNIKKINEIIPNEYLTEDLYAVLLQSKKMDFDEIPDNFKNIEYIKKLLSDYQIELNKINSEYITDDIEKFAMSVNVNNIRCVKQENIIYTQDLVKKLLNENVAYIKYIPKEHLTFDNYKFAIDVNIKSYEVVKNNLPENIAHKITSYFTDIDDANGNNPMWKENDIVDRATFILKKINDLELKKTINSNNFELLL